MYRNGRKCVWVGILPFAAPDGAAFLLRLLQGFDLLGVEFEEIVVQIKLLLHLVPVSYTHLTLPTILLA